MANIDYSLEAGLKYIVLSGVASAVLFFGIALLYLETGHLDFIGIREFTVASTHIHPFIFFTGTTLLLVGICFKLSLFPFHLWTPDVYQGAPAPATTFIATVSKGAIFAVFLRYFVAIRGLNFETLDSNHPINIASITFTLVAVIAALSMIAGNWLALLQNNMKRLLAYSSIAHLGYLLVAFLTLQTLSISAAVEACMVYLIAYLMTSLIAFGIVTLFASTVNPQGENDEYCELRYYRGLFWRHPLLALALTIALLSLAGIPLTLGFIGKFYLLTVGVQAGFWWLIAALIIGSGIGLFYYLRVITTLYKSTDNLGDLVNWSHTPIFTISCVTISLLSFGVLIYGVYPQPLLETVQTLVSTLSPSVLPNEAISSTHP